MKSVKKIAEFSSLIKNITALFSYQAINYIVPMITLPYLSRTLLPNSYGLLSLGQSISLYVGIMVEYGFMFAGTREVAKYRENSSQLKKVLGDVVSAKIFLSLISLIIPIAFYFIDNLLKGEIIILGAAYLTGVFQGFSFFWYFQGIEKMNSILFFDAFAKLLSVLFIFIFVKTPQDLQSVLFIQGFSFLIPTFIGGYFLLNMLKAQRISLECVKNGLKLGFAPFIFRFSVSTYTFLNPLILSFFVPISNVGYYTGAERLAKAFLSLLNPISQAFYPRISKEINLNPEKAVRLVQFSFYVSLIAGILIFFAIFFTPEFWVNLILGENYKPSIDLFKLFAPLPLIIALNSVLGIQWMFPKRLDNEYNRIIIIAGLSNVVLLCSILPIYGVLGASLITLFIELLILIWLLIFLTMKKQNPLLKYSHIKSISKP